MSAATFYLIHLLCLIGTGSYLLYKVCRGWLARSRANGNVGTNVTSEPLLLVIARAAFLPLLILYFVRAFVGEPFKVPTASMVPTVDVGDFVLIDKFIFGSKLPIFNITLRAGELPDRGDVVIFVSPHNPSNYYIKRVVGLPGDEVDYTNNVLTINGKATDEQPLTIGRDKAGAFRVVEERLGDHSFHAIKHSDPGLYSVKGRWKVPAGHYFMLGDNRDDSGDSREWGSIAAENILGKAMYILHSSQTTFGVKKKRSFE